MGRAIASANFIYNNTLNGTIWQPPVQSEQDAWDVGAVVQGQTRPQKANLDCDYPVALDRPVDSGYGPYVDGFSQDQHSLGPFEPTRAKIMEMRSAPPPAQAIEC